MFGQKGYLEGHIFFLKKNFLIQGHKVKRIQNEIKRLILTRKNE